MKREAIVVAAVLSIAFAGPAFAAEGTQSPAETTSNTETTSDFEQMKTDYLKRLEDKMNRLQQQKTCTEEAQSQEDLRNCKWKKWKKKGKGYGYPGTKKGLEGSSGSVQESTTQIQ